MNKFLASSVLAVILPVAALACTAIMPTNVDGIRWQNCPESNAVAIGNFGPSVIDVSFRVFYAGGSFDDFNETLGPQKFTSESASGAVTGLRVINYIVH
jgi:hypothetical protein